jgi:hypothetical protein
MLVPSIYLTHSLAAWFNSFKGSVIAPNPALVQCKRGTKPTAFHRSIIMERTMEHSSHSKKAPVFHRYTCAHP